MKTKSFLKKYVFTVLFIMAMGNFCLMAQPLPPNPQSPIIGGAGILVLLGLFFGIRRYMRNKK